MFKAKYRIVRSGYTGLYHVQKKYLWLFWGFTSSGGFTFEEAERQLEELVLKDSRQASYEIPYYDAEGKPL